MSDNVMAQFLAHPEQAGVFFDFDGTLSEIVSRPENARPVEGVPDLLRTLAARFALVAVVSGRPASELMEWLGSDGVEIWGLHGAESTREGSVHLAEELKPFVPLMHKVKGECEEAIARMELTGVKLEDKGAILALHFRNAADGTWARNRLAGLIDEVCALHGLRSVEGRMVFELRPPVELSKGRVLIRRALSLDLRAAAFVGDDPVDLPAFDALDDLAAEGVLAVRVAVSSAESPPELIDRADLVLEGPRGVTAWLRELAS
ncbi:MAG: trehalose-phosphatase [Actinomycetota bacterium]